VRPIRLQARVGKLEQMRLAAMAAAQQQFGRFRPLQIVLRVNDTAIDLFAGLGADKRQPAASRCFLHNQTPNNIFNGSVLI